MTLAAQVVVRESEFVGERAMPGVVVGVDGSPASRDALCWAAGFADRASLPLHVVWAWQYPADSVGAIGLSDVIQDAEANARIESQLRALLTDVLGERADAVTGAAIHAQAADALLRTAEQHEVSMLVVGSRGRGGFTSLLLGSVSRQVCEHATRPVTVVRELPREGAVDFETIVVGIDGSPPAARAMTFAADLVETFGAELVVAHAASPPEPPYPPYIEPKVDLDTRRTFAARWCAPLRDRGLAHELVVVDGDPRHTLPEVVAERDADLLVVGSRGRGALANVLLGSVATALAQQGRSPVTIVPPER
jgi:nucleotide-binding universal stress UspA family protein